MYFLSLSEGPFVVMLNMICISKCLEMRKYGVISHHPLLHLHFSF
jgi:hypothetical protein